ncbi:MAG: carbohydrate ABC transporter permease [Candidatus Limnocylindrales bacterium]
MTAAANRPAPRPTDGRRLGLRARRGAGTAGMYALLIAIAIVFMFPFIYMLTTALKTSEEFYRYPPQLLPMQAATATVAGEELPLYRIPIDERTVEMVPIETGVRAGVFAPSDDLEATTVVPLEEATAILDAAGDEVLLAVDGEELPVYEVDGQQVVKVRNTAVAQFVAPSDPDLTAYAVLRTAEAVERPTANPENFPAVLDRAGFDRSLTNTILVTLAVVGGTLFTSIIGGYAFARIPFPFRNTLFFIYLGSIMIPFVVLIIPLYQLMVGIGWVDSIPALIFPWIFSAYGTFLMRQFFVTLPKELEEAAFIDGASRWTVLWRIYVPLSLPALATLATFQFLYAWNSFVWPFIVISTGNDSAQVLTVALSQFGGRAADSPQLVFAGVTIAVLFPIGLFVILQRYFQENVASSGIK